MSGPLVSILIPCFNAERWVSTAIASALQQTWRNKEVVVIDDGSTGASLEKIAAFRGAIRWETGGHRGLCAAQNLGIARARGSYIQFLDAAADPVPDRAARHPRRAPGSQSLQEGWGVIGAPSAISPHPCASRPV